jgi:transposase-like protein
MINTREIAKEYRLSHWGKIMQERSQSGLSIKAYCRQMGICGNTYFYWQRKLRKAACEQLCAPAFTEVKLLESRTRNTPATPPPPGQICVEAKGMQITADSGYPVEKLSALLRELRQL